MQKSYKKTTKVVKIIDRYIQAESKINELFFYTRNFCKSHCPKKPVGCCDYNWYGHKIPQNNIGDAFEKRRKQIFRKHIKVNICKYLDLEKGCILKRLKNPSCIGTLCGVICRKLKKDFGIIYNTSKSVNFFDRILKNENETKETLFFYREIEDMTDTIKSNLQKNKKIRKFWEKKRQN